eukprot:gene9027-biopygen6084
MGLLHRCYKLLHRSYKGREHLPVAVTPQLQTVIPQLQGAEGSPSSCYTSDTRSGRMSRDCYVTACSCGVTATGRSFRPL